MPTRHCFLFALCLCFANVSSGAAPQALQQKDATTQHPTGRPNEILCSCKFVELSAAAAAEFDAAADLAAPRDPRRPHSLGVAVYKNAEKALRKLRESGRARVNEGLPIATPVDKPSAAVLSGGEFPILIPTGSSNRVKVKWQQFGYRFEVVPHWLDTGRLQLQVNPEIVTRDMKHAVVSNGLTIPGLTTRGACVRAEMNLGETLVVNFGSDPENQDEAHAITLFMVTPVAYSSSN
jgi:pilus assembly protein CpaC